MTARYGLIAMFVAMVGIGAAAQQPTGPAPGPTGQPPNVPPPAKPTPAAQAKPAPEPPRQPINVKIEVTISDQTGKTAAMKKMVTAVAGDSRPARVRAQVDVQGLPSGMLNLDVTPAILPNGRILTSLALEYTLPQSGEPPSSGPRQVLTRIQENLSVNLDDGKPLVVSQSADPVSDRQVTVEVKATILK